MDRGELEGLDRESLVVQAQAAGIRRARILTRPELIDELLRLDPEADESQLRKTRGFFGRARDLVARVVERGLHLPDAADRIRTMAIAVVPPVTSPRVEPQAMPTVTLAEIYAAQGHRARAVETLRRVLEREPDHTAARALLARLEDDAYVPPAPPLPPEPEVEPELFPSDEEEEQEEEEEEEQDEEAEDIEDIEDVFDGADEAAVQTARGEDVEAEAAAASIPPSGFSVAQDDDDVDDDDVDTVDAHARTDVFEVVPVREAAHAAAPPEPDEIDDCIAIPLPRDASGGRMYTRWNVSWSTIGALLGARPDGRFVVRAHVVTPSWDGPRSETRDLIVDPDDGEAVLQALPEPSVVRVAVGWLEGTTFVPLAHSPALDLRGDRLTMWTPRGSVAVHLDDPSAAPIARALDASRRVTEAHG